MLGWPGQEIRGKNLIGEQTTDGTYPYGSTLTFEELRMKQLYDT